MGSRHNSLQCLEIVSWQGRAWQYVAVIAYHTKSRANSSGLPQHIHFKMVNKHRDELWCETFFPFKEKVLFLCVDPEKEAEPWNIRSSSEAWQSSPGGAQMTVFIFQSYFSDWTKQHHRVITITTSEWSPGHWSKKGDGWHINLPCWIIQLYGDRWKQWRQHVGERMQSWSYESLARGWLHRFKNPLNGTLIDSSQSEYLTLDQWIPFRERRTTAGPNVPSAATESAKSDMNHRKISFF